MSRQDTIARLIITLLDRGWTQEELAIEVGTSQTYISTLSRGKGPKKGPSLEIGENLKRLYSTRKRPPPLVRRTREERMRQQVRYPKQVEAQA